MFRKLITNLSFSPTLIGEVAIYAKKLKREEKLRRIGLFLLVPALALQILAFSRPPESPNTASKHDLIYGGAQTVEQVLYHYNRNSSFIQNKLSTLGISHNEVRTLTPTTIHSANLNPSTYVVTSQAIASAQEGAKKLQYEKAEGETGVLHLSPLKYLQAKPATYQAFVGSSDTIGTFYLLANSGAVIISTLPDTLTYIETASPISTSVSVHNNTQNTPYGAAHASDRLTYTLTATNTDKINSHSFTFAQSLTDLLEYADISDTQGATLDTRSQTIHWPPVDIAPNETKERYYTARLKSQIPATAQGKSNLHSFDCVIQSTFGNTALTPVSCPLVKHIEAATKELPITPTPYLILFTAVVGFLTLFYYARSLQQKEEIRLIRHDANEGALL